MGASLSFTVTVNVHRLLLLAASVAVQVTKVVPLENALPLPGLPTKVWPGQLSVVVGANATTAVQTPGSVFCVMGAGQVIVGFSWSSTVTLKVQEAVFSEVSVTVQVTNVVPLAK